MWVDDRVWGSWNFDSWRSSAEVCGSVTSWQDCRTKASQSEKETTAQVVCLFVYLFICLFVYLSFFRLFIRLFIIAEQRLRLSLWNLQSTWEMVMRWCCSILGKIWPRNEKIVSGHNCEDRGARAAVPAATHCHCDTLLSWVVAMRLVAGTRKKS